VLRERPTSINSENRQVMPVKLSRLAGLLGFRMADAICEPVIYRDLLPRGLTALDVLDEATLNAPPGPLHLAAQQEVRGLIKSLNLPLRPHRRQHADAYSARSRATARLLEIEDIFAA
jgi:chromosome partitioning protein